MELITKHIAETVVNSSKYYVRYEYVGRMFNKDLYYIARNLIGHVGMPIYILVDDDGKWEYLDGGMNILRAMEMREKNCNNNK